MKAIFKSIIAAAILSLSVGAAAQNLNSAYFLDGFAYGHELNPAKDYDRSGYFSFPVLGNTNIALRGNLSLKDFFYPNPNRNAGGPALVTYLHPDIPSSTAMDGFSGNNKLLMDMRFDIVSIGFHDLGGYNTITLGARTNLGFNVPYELFDLTKNLANRDYDISDFGATGIGYLELALGHSHKVAEAWRIGAKVKALLGGGYARLKMDNLSLDLSQNNRWTATANATAEVGVKGFTWGGTETKEYKYKKDANGNPATYEQLDLGDVDFDKPGVNGFGAALDLGVEWDLGKQGLLNGMKVSASLLDLGFIRWNNVAIASNRGESFVFNGFHNVQVSDGPGVPLDEQADDLGDRLSDLVSLQDGGSGSRTRALGATLNLAVEYALPVYKKLKFGLLSTSRLQGVYSWNEERVSATLSPCKMFELAVSGGAGTMGGNIGWVLNFHPRVCNIFIGSDHCVGKFSKQWIPLRSNYDFCMGINVPFGKSRVR